jgi:hypothetical protein
MIYDNSNELLGILPAAEDPTDKRRVISHPGITYAGLIHAGKLNATKQETLFLQLIEHFRSEGYKEIIYKAIPSIFHKIPSEDDIYSLFKINAKNFRADLSCAVEIKSPLNLSERRLRSFKKSKKIGSISVNPSLPKFWEVLESNLQEKHNARPTHTLDEIQELSKIFPDKIQLVTAEIDSNVEAGILIFIQNKTLHFQYIASSQTGQKNNLLDFVINHIAEKYSAQKFNWLNFGISTENNGLTLNSGLYQFKYEFGGGGISYKQFEIKL